MDKFRIWLPILLVVTAVVISGCLPDEMPTQVVPTPTFTAVPQPINDGGDNGNQLEAASTEDEVVAEATPFDLTQLHATDPTTVNLASGRPTLVEFFAFW